MLNYIRSELYRMFHSPAIYILTGACMALVLAMNVILWIFYRYTPQFPYGTVAFSFSNLTYMMSIPMYLAACLGLLVYGDDCRHRTAGNSLIFGFSRIQIYLGKLAVSLVCAVFCLAAVEGTLIGSAYLLLENSGSEPLENLLTATAVCAPAFVAGLFAAVTLAEILRSSFAGVWAWLGIMVAFPKIVMLLGLKFRVFALLKEWLVYNVVGSLMFTEGEVIFPWMTQKGAARCVLAGILGIVVIVFAGLLGVRRKEL